MSTFPIKTREHPPAPEHLSDPSKKIWRDLCEAFEMDEGALVILATLCDSNDRRLQARRAIEEAGSPFIKDRFGIVRGHPGLALERDATLMMQRAYRLLGLDQVGPPPDQMDLFRKGPRV